MRARELNKRVELFVMGAVSDGFGGDTPTESLNATVWAKVKNAGKGTISRLTELGLNDLQHTAEFTVRSHYAFDYNATNWVFKFAGARWHPISVSDEDLEKRFVTIVARRELVTRTIQQGIGGDSGFPYTFC